MDTIHLHIGQSKTGSSFLQSALAGGIDILREHDIHYEIDDHTRQRASEGHISSGNYWPREGALETLLAQMARSDLARGLISSESIFELLAAQGLRFVDTVESVFPNARIDVLCYVRDPLEHAVSLYQQSIKRDGNSAPFRGFLLWHRYPRRTGRVLDALRERGATITVFNYSRHTSDLMATFEDWLRLPRGTLPEPPVERINRSMTRAELELQKIFNRRVGRKSSRYVSDALCQRLPHLEPEAPYISPEDLETFLTRVRDEIGSEEYRRNVPEAERPHVGEPGEYVERYGRPEDPDGALTLTREQLEAIALTMKAELEQSEQRHTAMREQIARLRQALDQARRNNAALQQRIRGR